MVFEPPFSGSPCPPGGGRSRAGGAREGGRYGGAGRLAGRVPGSGPGGGCGPGSGVSAPPAVRPDAVERFRTPGRYGALPSACPRQPPPHLRGRRTCTRPLRSRPGGRRRGRAVAVDGAGAPLARAAGEPDARALASPCPRRAVPVRPSRVRGGEADDRGAEAGAARTTGRRLQGPAPARRAAGTARGRGVSPPRRVPKPGGRGRARARRRRRSRRRVRSARRTPCRRGQERR